MSAIRHFIECSGKTLIQVISLTVHISLKFKWLKTSKTFPCKHGKIGIPAKVRTRCCSQLWVWHMFCGVGLWWVMPPNKIHGSYWNTVWVSIDPMDLCQTHPLRSHFRSPPFGVIRLHSEIDQIHLSIKAQCGTACLPTGDCHTSHLWELKLL